jgi:hypothetical protein
LFERHQDCGHIDRDTEDLNNSHELTEKVCFCAINFSVEAGNETDDVCDNKHEHQIVHTLDLGLTRSKLKWWLLSLQKFV